jgi:hypothetical protein
MDFFPTGDNVLNPVNTGEAPTLSSTYGGYDNGANAFNFYDNFKGKILSSAWIVPSGSNYIVNNGFSGTNSGGSTTAVYNANIEQTSSVISEWELNLSSTTYPGIESYFQLNRYTSNSNMHWLGAPGTSELINNGGNGVLETIPSTGSQIFGL